MIGSNKYLFMTLLGILLTVSARGMNPDLKHRSWDAAWITHPEIPVEEAGVYLFRKTFTLDTVPDDFLIHVSADNRYKLYVNGEMVCYGPSRGDLLHWRFESIDIAGNLKRGTNTLCAVVWNHAELRPVPHASSGTGLLVQGDTGREKAVNTDGGWKVVKDEAYGMHAIRHLKSYYAVGPGESFDARKHPWNWMEPGMDDSRWLDARVQDKGQMEPSIGGTGRLPLRTLVQRGIPFMEMIPQEFEDVRSASGIEGARSILAEDRNLVIAPHSKVTILLDQGRLTTAYPSIRFSGGRGSEIRLTYAESLYIHEMSSEIGSSHRDKGNRNEVEGKFMRGNYDIIVADGGENRSVEPLWWRTFRYVEVEVATQDEPLILHKLDSTFTGYPLEEKAGFECDRPVFSEIWNVGWHSQRLCAGENFYDCPYYEQLQYAGDTRIQGLVTFYASGDTALWKKSIECFHDSRLPFGLTQSRYPSYITQIIPTFSLVWITMCHDYLMHCDDPDFIKPMLPAVGEVLQWFETRLDKTGLPGDLPYWNFVDWAAGKGWKIGVPPLDGRGHSSVIALQYVYTLQKAADLYDFYGRSVQADECRLLAGKVREAVRESCWDEGRQLVADTPAKTTFSQHANVLAVLAGAVPQDQQQALLERTIADQSIVQCTYYFRFYLAEALKKAGMADQYVDLLGPWEEMLERGLTTFAEKPDPTRSDCHAWSASPLYHFLSLVSGIEPDSPGFETVRIHPAMGSLSQLNAHMPHRRGVISLKLYKTEQGNVEGEVVLPAGLEGIFEMNESIIRLKPGRTGVSISGD